MPPKRRSLIARAIKHYLNGDFVEAIHLFIPQIEAVVRHVVEELGGLVLKSNRHGGMNFPTLDPLLQSNCLAAAFGDRGKEVIRYLRVLLTDQRGWNVRNDVSHGLWDENRFMQPVADRLFHVLLVFALIRPTDPTVQDQESNDE